MQCTECLIVPVADTPGPGFLGTSWNQRNLKFLFFNDHNKTLKANVENYTYKSRDAAQGPEPT